MQTAILYNENHKWMIFGRNPAKPEKIIDTNQYLIVAGNQGILLDPGGTELFAPILAAVLRHAPIRQLTHIFASHQDPDVISSLGLWDQVIPDAKLYCSWLWEGSIRHIGLKNIEYMPIRDDGGTIHVGNIDLTLIPAHYLHSPGNFHLYDPVAKILFSGDLGSSLEPADAPFFVDNFDEQTDKMLLFHQRWMPCNRAKQDWIDRVRSLDIEVLAPQHGRVFKGDDVNRFLDWFESLDVGAAMSG